MATLWVNSISSGTLDVSVYTMTDNGKEVLLFQFPTLTSGSTDLLLKKSGVSLQRFLVRVTYTGVVDYEVYVRAVEGVGESSTRILGATSLETDGVTVTTTPGILIPASLIDRSGLVIKNWGTTASVYISEDITKLPLRAYPLAPRDGVAMDVGAGVVIYAVSDTGPADIRIAQSGAS